jgi:hypothetical protein
MQRSSIPLACVGCLLLITGPGCLATATKTTRLEPERTVTLPEARDEPLTIAMSTVGRFSEGYSWYLSMNSAGQAQLTIHTFPQPTRREFAVSVEQLASLRKVLKDERFFELADEYGEIVPDGSTDTITVTAGQVTRCAKVHYLMNWVYSDHAKLREPSRAVRVGLEIRNWFDDAKAVDLRKFDQMVLDAARESN